MHWVTWRFSLNDLNPFIDHWRLNMVMNFFSILIPCAIQPSCLLDLVKYLILINVSNQCWVMLSLITLCYIVSYRTPSRSWFRYNSSSPHPSFCMIEFTFPNEWNTSTSTWEAGSWLVKMWGREGINFSNLGWERESGFPTPRWGGETYESPFLELLG